MSTKKIYYISIVVVISLLIFQSAYIKNSVLADSIIKYVKPSAVGLGNCNSWENACTLQTALSGSPGAVDTWQVWVTEGVYIPGTNRTDTYQLKNNIEILGGFPSEGGELGERDPKIHESIINGDIGIYNNHADNIKHLITGSGTDTTAVLDGFTIKLGYLTDGGTIEGSRGAGILIVNGSPTLRNLIIKDNYSIIGAGLGAENSNSLIENVSFINNVSEDWGGGAHFHIGTPILIGNQFIRNHAGNHSGGGLNCDGCNATLINNKFNGNVSGNDGGGINIFQGNLSMVNSLFVGNKASGKGGGMHYNLTSISIYNSTFVSNEAGNYGGGLSSYYGISSVTNSIFWNNSAASNSQIYTDGDLLPVTYSIVDGGYSGTGNLSSDPLFISAASSGPDGIWGTEDDDYGNQHVNLLSGAINAGNSDALPLDTLDLDEDANVTEKIPFDLDWRGRIKNVIVDIGCYEIEISFNFLSLIDKE